MNAPREGQRVAYVGDGGDGLRVGEGGKVLSSAGDSCHVLDSEGVLAGQVVLLKALDLVVAERQVADDCLDGSSLVTVAVRNVYDHAGREGLLNALNEEGHLASLAPIAEEAMTVVASRISQDPSFREVLGELDPDEGADLVSFAASILLRDAFGGGDE